MVSLVALLLGALLWVPGGALRCLGETGNPVDWFVIYKLPARSGPGNEAWRGLSYRYLDGSLGGWRDGVGLINSSQGALGRSLQPLYRANASQASCSWTKKGASGWSTACHASRHLYPLVHTTGLTVPNTTGRPSVCLFPSLSSQRLAGSW
uniref:Deoxyribonuclease-2-alpha n=1 Tax=Chinchilla lanigera TaxID=34839 RepID=A0A8C2VX74_CHILA